MTFDHQNYPAWVKERHGLYVGPGYDDKSLELDGDFTAQDLRDLADMIDANQPFSMKGWGTWADVRFSADNERYYIAGPNGTALFDTVIEVPNSRQRLSPPYELNAAPGWLTELPFNSHRYQK